MGKELFFEQQTQCCSGDPLQWLPSGADEAGSMGTSQLCEKQEELLKEGWWVLEWRRYTGSQEASTDRTSTPSHYFNCISLCYLSKPAFFKATHMIQKLPLVYIPDMLCTYYRNLKGKRHAFQLCWQQIIYLPSYIQNYSCLSVRYGRSVETIWPRDVRDHISGCITIEYRDLFKGWGAREFPTLEVDFPLFEFLKWIDSSTNVLKHVLSPPEESAIDILV